MSTEHPPDRDPNHPTREMSQDEDPLQQIPCPEKELPDATDLDEDDIDTRFYPGTEENNTAYNGRTIVKDRTIWRHYIVREKTLSCTTVLHLGEVEVEFNAEWELNSEDSPIKEDETIEEFCERHFEQCSPELDYRIFEYFLNEYENSETKALEFTDKKTDAQVIVE